MPDSAQVRLTDVQVRLADGVRLHVDVSGPDSAPLTVVLLHGWTLDGRIWHRQVAALREAFGAAVRVISYDARGHGRSGPITRPTATLGQLGDDLSEVLAQVAPAGPVVLAGHSLGGMTMIEYAHRQPVDFARRIAGLVFVATTAEGHTHTAYGVPAPIARLIRIAETTSAGILARCGDWRTPPALLYTLRPALRWLLFGDVCDPADIRLTTAAVARASFVSIGGFRPSVGAQQRLATLAALGDVPAAALVGDRDRLTPPPCALSIAEALPSTALTVCPDAGHMLMLERADVVTSALCSVINQARPARPATTPSMTPAMTTAGQASVPAGRRRRYGSRILAQQPQRLGARHDAACH